MTNETNPAELAMVASNVVVGAYKDANVYDDIARTATAMFAADSTKFIQQLTVFQTFLEYYGYEIKKKETPNV